jgi:hypothetical protein
MIKSGRKIAVWTIHIGLHQFLEDRPSALDGIGKSIMTHHSQFYIVRSLLFGALTHSLPDDEIDGFLFPQISVGEGPHSPEDTLHPMIQRG